MRNAVPITLLSICLVGSGAAPIAQVPPPERVWTPSAEAPAQLPTPLEMTHMFIGDVVSADFGEFAASHNAFVIPTLAVLRCRELNVPNVAADERLAPLLPRQTRRLAALSPQQGRMPCGAVQPALKQLIAAGVPILAGSDEPIPGSTYGASIHGELELLVENGLTALQALIAATSAPADAFRLNDRGRIKPGLRADLVLVDGDPMRDILATRNVVGMWKRSQPVARQRFE